MCRLGNGGKEIEIACKNACNWAVKFLNSRALALLQIKSILSWSVNSWISLHWQVDICFIKSMDRNPPTMSEVCDTPITTNHGGTNSRLSKSTLWPDEDLQCAVETLRSISKWQTWDRRQKLNTLFIKSVDRTQVFVPLRHRRSNTVLFNFENRAIIQFLKSMFVCQKAWIVHCNY